MREKSGGRGLAGDKKRCKTKRQELIVQKRGNLNPTVPYTTIGEKNRGSGGKGEA